MGRQPSTRIFVLIFITLITIVLISFGVFYKIKADELHKKRLKLSSDYTYYTKQIDEIIDASNARKKMLELGGLNFPSTYLYDIDYVNLLILSEKRDAVIRDDNNLSLGYNALLMSIGKVEKSETLSSRNNYQKMFGLYTPVFRLFAQTGLSKSIVDNWIYKAETSDSLGYNISECIETLANKGIEVKIDNIRFNCDVYFIKKIDSDRFGTVNSLTNKPNEYHVVVDGQSYIIKQ